jgi:hypothetical protein
MKTRLGGIEKSMIWAASSTESGMALRATESDEDAAADRQLFQNCFFVGSMDSVAWAASSTEGTRDYL